MKQIIICILLVISFNEISALDMDLEVSSEIKIINTDKPSEYWAMYKYQGKDVRIKIIDDVGEMTLSSDHKYALIFYRTDIIGSIIIYSSEPTLKIVEETYIGEDPIWKGNSLEYQAVKWFGEGYSVREKHRFFNGKIKRDKQYIGNYHGFDQDRVDPLCSRYSIDMYSDYSTLIKILSKNLDFIKPYINTYEALVKAVNAKEINSKIIIEIAEKSNIAMGYLEKDDASHYYSAFLFSLVYPIVDKACQAKVINKNQKIVLTKNMLNTLAIDDTIVPWLFQ